VQVRVSVDPGLHVPDGQPPQAPQVQEPEQVRDSVPPQVQVRVSVDPGLHVPDGQPPQAPQVQEPEQVRDSVPPQAQARVSVDPGLHVPPAHPPQEPQVHDAEHVRASEPPQVQARDSVLPRQQVNVSSQAVSPSSSVPLHSSSPVEHVPQAQPGAQVRAPSAPVGVVQAATSPRQQARPFSHTPSQSSSAPLQSSAGGAHGSHEQAAEQRLVPVEPQGVAQPSVAPAMQEKSSSVAPSQSSSSALQVSGRPPASEQGPVPSSRPSGTASGSSPAAASPAASETQNRSQPISAQTTGSPRRCR
jgi:hypothetical protein